MRDAGQDSLYLCIIIYTHKCIYTGMPSTMSSAQLILNNALLNEHLHTKDLTGF